MPLPGSESRWASSHASRCSGEVSAMTPEPQRVAGQAAAQGQHVVAAGPELLHDVGDDAGVGGGRGREHRGVCGQRREQVADAAVVGAEVVAPVGDAVGLVDDEQAAAAGQVGQLLVAEPRVVEPLGADEQHVDLVGRQRRRDLPPLLGVGGVHRHRADAGPARPRRSGRASARAAATRSRSARRPRPGAARWTRSRPPTCPSRCAARRAPGGDGRPAPRRPRAGRRGSRRRRARRGGAARWWPGCAGRVPRWSPWRPPYAAGPTALRGCPHGPRPEPRRESRRPPRPDRAPPGTASTCRSAGATWTPTGTSTTCSSCGCSRTPG